MKILLFPASYLPITGGLQVVTSLLAKELVAMGHRVEVVTNRYPRSLPKKERLQGVFVHRRLFLFPEVRYFFDKRIDLFLASLYYYPMALLFLYRLIKDFKPDVINIHFPNYQPFFILVLRKFFNFKIVVSCHGSDIERWVIKGFETEWEVTDKKKKSLKLLLKIADSVTACSQSGLNNVVKFEPAILGKGHVVHNGIEMGNENKEEIYSYPKFFILAVGRLIYKKGMDILIKAFSKVSNKFPNIDLILAGDGPERNNLEKIANDLQLEKRVNFFGNINRGEVAKLLRASEFLVVPSRVEAFGVVIIEAMKEGTPVIAVRAGGPEEIIEDGVTGVLVNNNDEKGLVTAIMNFIEKKSLREFISKNAKEKVSLFNSSHMASNYLKIFDLVLKNKS